MNEQVRVLVVDDEPLARKRICDLLDEHPDFSVIGQCGDGLSALKAIGDLRPDIVFFDIQMPEMNGLEAVESLDSESLPQFVFVTAYDEHAVRAFELNALDYLLKPFDSERFAATLSRVRARLHQPDAGRDSALERKLLAMLNDLRKNAYASRLLVRAGDRASLIEVNKIVWIEAEGRHVRIHLEKESHLLREPMSHLESRLDPDQFARIHRSAMVNLDWVQSFEAMFHGEYKVCLKGGQTLTMSRGYRAKLQDRFGKSR